MFFFLQLRFMNTNLVCNLRNWMEEIFVLIIPSLNVLMPLRLANTWGTVVCCVMTVVHIVMDIVIATATVNTDAMMTVTDMIVMTATIAMTGTTDMAATQTEIVSANLMLATDVTGVSAVHPDATAQVQIAGAGVTAEAHLVEAAQLLTA